MKLSFWQTVWLLFLVEASRSAAQHLSSNRNLDKISTLKLILWTLTHRKTQIYSHYFSSIINLMIMIRANQAEVSLKKSRKRQELAHTKKLQCKLTRPEKLCTNWPTTWLRTLEISSRRWILILNDMALGATVFVT